MASIPRELAFRMKAASDHQSAWVGVPSVLLRKQAGSWFSPAGTVSSRGAGFYEVSPVLGDQDVPGWLLLYATGSGSDPVFQAYWIGPGDGPRAGDTTYPLPIAIMQSSNPTLPLIGATGVSIKVGIGNNSMASPSSSSVVEVGYGFYDVTLGSSDLAEGNLLVYASATGASPSQQIFYIGKPFSADQPPVDPNYLGRFRRGDTVSFSVTTASVPDNAPVAVIKDPDNATVATLRMPTRTGKLFTASSLVGPWALGTFSVSITYSISGSQSSLTKTFDVVSGGDSGGSIISMHVHTRPESNYVVAQLTSGVVVQGRNPHL